MGKDIKNTDPREIGTGGLEGLQWRPNPDDKKYSYDYTLDNVPSLKEFLETPSDSPETKRRVSEGYSVGSMDTEGIYAPDLYDSKYDHEVKSINELENLEDFRAEKQPWYEKFGNGLAKMGILAKDTYLQTVGLGFTSMFSDVEGKESIWNNDLAEISYQNMKEMEKKFPNYYTEEEREAYATGKWTTMLDTANFWGDHFLKNLGFTIGAGAGAMFSPQGFAIGALSRIPYMGRFLARALGTMYAAAGESNVEAYHAFKEFKESEFAKNSQAVEMELAKIRNKYSSQLNELSKAKQYALSMLNSNISDAEKNKLLTLLSEIDNKERYLTESLEQDYANYENTLKGVERDIEERALSVGNTTWAANFALLSVTEFFSFGKFFDSGAMQRTIRFAHNRAQDASKIGRRIAGQAVYDAVQEGPIEEMGQKFISESAKSAYSADSPDAYYEAYNNEDAKIKIKNWQKGMIEGFHQSYGSEAAWEEGFIGAITGMMPGATSNINGGTSSDDTFLGKNKKIGLRGGLPGLIAEYVSTKNRNKKLVDRVNSLLEEYVDTDGKVKNALAAHLHFSEIMGGLSYTDDTFSFKNARDSSDFSLIQAMSEAGLVKNLDEMLNVDYSTLSDEELSSLAQQMGWEDVTVGNKKQSPIATKEGKEAFLKQLNQNKERMQEAYSNYKESVEFINSNPKLRELSYDQKTQLAWLHFKERAISNRQKQINDSIRTSLTAIQSHIDDYIYTNEASENKTTQERIKDYKKLKDIIENIIAGNPIEIKDKKEWISFLQKGNVQKALSYNNKSFKEGKEFIKGLRDLVLLENLKNEFKSSLDTYLKNPNTLVEETKKKEEKKQKEEEDKKKKKILNAANSASVSSLTGLDEEEEKTVSQIVGTSVQEEDPIGYAIRKKLEQAKKAKKELKTLDDIKNTILKGDILQDERDKIEGLFDIIEAAFTNALNNNKRNEFEDIGSSLWTKFIKDLDSLTNRTMSITEKQSLQNIIDAFVHTQEFKDSLPSNSNTQPNVTTTTGKNGSAVPSLPTKRKGNKKEKLEKGSNPFNEEEAEEERKNNQKNGGNKVEESAIKRNPDKKFNYWKTAITEYFLHLVKDKKTGEELWVKFTELIDNEKKYVTLEGKELNLKYTKEEIKWIKEVTKYLEDQGCFSYLKNNNLKVGDKVTFFADIKFAEKNNLIVRDKDGNITDIPIFIKKGNQIIGVLPNKTFREKNAKQEYLDEWIADFLTQLNNKKKTDESLISFEEGRTEVAEVLAGHLPYIKNYRRITEAFRQDDIKNMSIAIVGSNKDFILTDKGSNIKIRPYKGDKKPGKPFILMPIQSKEYTHMAVPMAMDTVNPVEGEVSLNGVLYDILNNLSGKESKLIFNVLNNIIFETIRVDFSKNGDISIKLDDGKTKSILYEGDPTNISKIIESFKEANLHFNVLLNGSDTRTINIFNSFSSITRDTNYNKLVLNTAKTNVGTTQENSDVMINSWYTLNPINDKGQQVTASRPEHQTTIAPKQKTITKANKKDRETANNVNQKAEKEKNRKKSKTSKKEKNTNIPQPQVDTVKPENDNTTSEKSTIEKIKTKLEEAGFDMDEIDEEEFFDALEEDIENLWGLLSSTPDYEIIKLERLTTKSIEKFIDYLENKGKARVTTEGTKETIDVEKEKAWFKEVFPNLDEDRIITTIDNFIRIRGNKYAYGMYKRGMITLSKIGASGTLYHEAFHFVFDLFVSQEEKENIFDGARDKFKLRDYIRKEHEDLEIEEQLAEAFRRYVQFEETPIIGSLVHIFRQLKHFIQSFLGNEAYIDNLFYRINNAKIDTSEVQPSSSVVRLKEEPYTQEMLDIKAKAIADGTFMKAPNGNPSNLNERQWIHVRTKAFKKWFGDWENDLRNASKIVDENGEPKEVYHGGDAGITVFNKNNRISTGYLPTANVGFFFTDSKENANHYSKLRKSRFGNNTETYSVFLNIKNPLYFDTIHDFREYMIEEPYKGYNEDGDIISKRQIPNEFDGIYVKQVNQSDLAKEIVAFNPNQIKSATDNIGTYDESNDDIRYREVEDEKSFWDNLVKNAGINLIKLNNKAVKLVVNSVTKSYGQGKRKVGYYDNNSNFTFPNKKEMQKVFDNKKYLFEENNSIKLFSTSKYIYAIEINKEGQVKPLLCLERDSAEATALKLINKNLTTSSINNTIGITVNSEDSYFKSISDNYGKSDSSESELSKNTTIKNFIILNSEEFEQTLKKFQNSEYQDFKFKNIVFSPEQIEKLLRFSSKEAKKNNNYFFYEILNTSIKNLRNSNDYKLVQQYLEDLYKVLKDSDVKIVSDILFSIRYTLTKYYNNFSSRTEFDKNLLKYLIKFSEFYTETYSDEIDELFQVNTIKHLKVEDLKNISNDTIKQTIVERKIEDILSLYMKEDYYLDFSENNKIISNSELIDFLNVTPDLYNLVYHINLPLFQVSQLAKKYSDRIYNEFDVAAEFDAGTPNWSSVWEGLIENHNNVVVIDMFNSLKNYIFEIMERSNWTSEYIDSLLAPLKEGIEVLKSRLGVNISEEEVERLELSGVRNIDMDVLKAHVVYGSPLINPSIAIINPNISTHKGYGDITLLMSNTLIENYDATLYPEDAYTPAFSNQRDLGKAYRAGQISANEASAALKKLKNYSDVKSISLREYKKYLISLKKNLNHNKESYAELKINENVNFYDGVIGVLAPKSKKESIEKLKLQDFNIPIYYYEDIEDDYTVTRQNQINAFVRAYKQNKQKVRLQNDNGVTKGFTKDGEIFINKDSSDSTTCVHEYTHLWVDALRKSNPELYQRGMLLAKENVELWNQIVGDNYYGNKWADLDIADFEHEVFSEVTARLTSKEANNVFNSIKNKSLIKALKQWISDFAEFIKDTFTSWTKDEANKISNEEFFKMPIRDLYKGINPNTIEDSTENKEEQLSAEDKSKLEKQKIRNFRINKLEYFNLSLEDLQYLEERGISKEEYNSMEMLEKEIVMKCR